MQRGRGRGRAHRQARSPAVLTVEVHLDDTLRALVIGAQGAVVKRTQALTDARIACPKLGEAGPTRVSGPHVRSVLHACTLIARQTRATSRCLCVLPGVGSLAALLHPTDEGSHLLFEGVGAAGGTNEAEAGAAVPFAAYCLPGLPARLVSSLWLASLVDDASFANF